MSKKVFVPCGDALNPTQCGHPVIPSAALPSEATRSTSSVDESVDPTEGANTIQPRPPFLQPGLKQRGGVNGLGPLILASGQGVHRGLERSSRRRLTEISQHVGNHIDVLPGDV
jgi:hypothetical protein